MEEYARIFVHVAERNRAEKQRAANMHRVFAARSRKKNLDIFAREDRAGIYRGTYRPCRAVAKFRN